MPEARGQRSWFSRIFLISDLRLLTSLVFVLFLVLPTHAADYTPPVDAGPWLNNLGWFMVIVASGGVLWKQLFPKRQPPIEQEFVSKADLEKFCSARHNPVGESLERIESKLQEIETKREASDRRHEDRAAKLHGRVDRLVPVVYSIAGRMQIQTPEEIS